METTRCVLFDLGGVLVDWDGVEGLVGLSGGRLTRERARRFWLESAWVREFECGRCGPEAFAAGAAAELGIEVAAERFLSEFESWDRGPLPGAARLVEWLGRRFVTGCLSNNNEVHWNKPALRALVAGFHHRFASHEMGCMKPDPAAFEHALRAMGARAGEVLFVDDTLENVEAARRLGLRAVQAKGIAAVESGLAASGIDCGAGA